MTALLSPSRARPVRKIEVAQRIDRRSLAAQREMCDEALWLPPQLRGVADAEIERAIKMGWAKIVKRTVVPLAVGGADTGVGVTDLASGAGVADVRGRQRTVGGVTNAVEQYVIAMSARIDSGVYHAHSGTLTVLAAAHATTSPLPGFAFLLNRSAAQMCAVRRVEFIEYPSAVTTFPTAPRITFERFTFTGTPSAGLIAPAKRIRTTQNGETADATNVGEFRTITTGLTTTYPTELIYAFIVRPVLIVYAAGTQAEPPVVPEVWYPEEGEGCILANGEGVVFRQPDAATASDTRKFHLDVTWEEYVL